MILGLLMAAQAAAVLPEIAYKIRYERQGLSVEVSYPPKKEAAARYRVTPKTPAGRVMPPAIGADYFHVTGDALFKEGVEDGEKPRRVTLTWDVPAGWALANSFGADAKSQTFTAPPDEYRHAIYAGGAFRLRRLEVRGKAVWLAIRGKWEFADAALAELVEKIVSAERAFWSDDDFPHYLITLRNMKGVSRGHGGSAYTSSNRLARSGGANASASRMAAPTSRPSCSSSVASISSSSRPVACRCLRSRSIGSRSTQASTSSWLR